MSKLNRDGGFDVGVGFVSHELEILKFEVENGLHRRIEVHFRQFMRFAGKLLFRLLDVVGIEVCVAECVDEFTGFKTRDLRDHHGEQGVGRDVERYAKEDIGGALVELAREFAVRDIELEECVAGRQRHFRDITRVPGRNDEAAGVRVVLNLLDHVFDLIDLMPI